MKKTDDMGHLDHLAAVALADVAHVLEREATYKGSWKRSGGRSAWFMLKRKIDRLIVMMARPEAPAHFNLENVADTIDAITYGRRLPGTNNATAEILGHVRDCYAAEDVFLKIEEDPSGKDGTPFAELRDLRQYLLLVEAEMVNQGVVVLPDEGGAFTMRMPPLSEEDREKLRKETEAHQGHIQLMEPGAVGDAIDPYQRVSDLTGLTRDVVENAVARAIAEQLRELWVKDPEPEELYDGVSKQSGIPRETLKNAMLTLVSGDAPPRPTRLVDDGVTHMDDRVAGFAYIVAVDPVTMQTYFNVDRRALPPDSCDYLRKLRLELNNKEWQDTLPEYRGMYSWREVPSKWVLADAWQKAWGKET